MSISKGHTYGSTEQVTNTKLHNLVDLAIISLEYDEITAGLLSSLASNAGSLSGYNIRNLQSLATGAGFVNWFNLSSFTSLASGATLRFNGTNGIYWA